MSIAKSNPILLIYDSNKLNASKRRSQLTKKDPTCSGFHRDEYLYASTEEGGENAVVNYVPTKENVSHGGYIGGLVRANKMKTGDKFLIILVPDSNKKQPQSTQTVE